jgi:hypothetical protein
MMLGEPDPAEAQLLGEPDVFQGLRDHLMGRLGAVTMLQQIENAEIHEYLDSLDEAMLWFAAKG